MAKKKTGPVNWTYETSENAKGDLYVKGNTPPGSVRWPFVFKTTLTYSGRMNQRNGIAPTSKDYQYKTELLFSKKDPMVKKMVASVEKEAAKHFGMKDASKLYLPFKDGDDKEEEDYHGKVFLALSLAQDAGPLPVFDADLDEITNPADIYAGCWAMANIQFKTYNAAGRKGVTVYWNSLTKIDDGERIGFDKTQSEQAKLKKAKPQKGVKIVDGEVVYN